MKSEKNYTQSLRKYVDLKEKFKCEILKQLHNGKKGKEGR